MKTRPLFIILPAMFFLWSCGADSPGTGPGGPGRSTAAEPADDGVQRSWKDPHGFEVDLPKDWGARVLGNGSVVMTPEPETLLGPQAFFWVMHLKKQRTAAEASAALIAAFKTALPDITAEGPHPLKGRLDDSCSMRGTFTLLGEPWSYLFLVSARGKVATLTGFSAPAAKAEAFKPALARALATFRLNPKLLDPKRIAPPPSEWVEWTDPKEAAFSMKVPKGWKVEGGIVRPYLDAWGMVTAKKDGKDSTAFSIYSPAPPLFTEPNQTLAMAGFREGMPYSASAGIGQPMIVMRHLGAKGYIEKWLAPQIAKTCPDAKVSWCRERPDFIKFQPKNPFMQTTSEGAECEMILTVGGAKVRGRAYAVTTRTVFPGGMGMWHAAVGTYCAPPEEFDQAQDVFWRARDTVAINPKWVAEEARQVAIRSKIIASAHEQITKTISQAYESRGRSMDEIGRKWSNSMLGQVDLVDPGTGDIRYGVPSGSNYYWKVGSDVIVGTDTHTSPGLGAEELQNLDDLMRK